MNTDIRDKTCDCHPETCGCAPCELVLDGDVVAWGEREGLARLQARFTSYDIAIGQAVAFAQYVEDHAKGIGLHTDSRASGWDSSTSSKCRTIASRN